MTEPLASNLPRNLERPSFMPGDDSIMDTIMAQRPTPEDERRAAQIVALNSTSNDDCRDLLDMLGLTERLTLSDGSVGSYYTEPRSI